MLGLLDINEREELIPEVAYYTEGQPRNLSTIIPGYHVIRIETHPVPEEYAFRVVRYCELSAWVENPALIIKLLSKFKHIPTFATAIKRLRASSPLKFYNKDRVWDSFLLALNLPFLSRVDTRHAVECFSYPLESTVKPAGIRVLVVKGPEKSGKSYTFEYIRYVNSVFARLHFNIIWVDFKKQITSRLGPAELIEGLLEQVNPNWKGEVSLPILNAQQSARWLLELVRLLINQIRLANDLANSTAQMLMILDGFDDPKVPRETIDLIQLLVSVAIGQVLVPENGDIIRLVLLGFTETVNNYRNRVRTDNIKPVNRNDIEVYFQNYAAYKGLVLDNNALKAIVDKVSIETMSDTPNRTRDIATKCLAIANGIFESKLTSTVEGAS